MKARMAHRLERLLELGELQLGEVVRGSVCMAVCSRRNRADIVECTSRCVQPRLFGC